MVPSSCGFREKFISVVYYFKRLKQNAVNSMYPPTAHMNRTGGRKWGAEDSRQVDKRHMTETVNRVIMNTIVRGDSPKVGFGFVDMVLVNPEPQEN